MDPFLIRAVRRATYFRGEIDAKGRPRKIRGYEKNVLMCVAANTKCDLDLTTSLSKTSLKGYRWYKGFEGEIQGERLLVEMLSESVKLTKAEIARQCSISFRRAMVIVSELQRIGVLHDYVIDVNMLSCTP